MINRRPKLKRTPTLADKVAEIVRSAGDDLEVRVSVYVILYKRGQDLVSASVPAESFDKMKKEIEAQLEMEGITDKVTFEAYKRQFPVWLNLERPR